MLFPLAKEPVYVYKVFPCLNAIMEHAGMSQLKENVL